MVKMFVRLEQPNVVTRCLKINSTILSRELIALMTGLTTRFRRSI